MTEEERRACGVRVDWAGARGGPRAALLGYAEKQGKRESQLRGEKTFGLTRPTWEKTEEKPWAYVGKS